MPGSTSQYEAEGQSCSSVLEVEALVQALALGKKKLKQQLCVAEVDDNIRCYL